MNESTLRSLIFECQMCDLCRAGRGVPGAYFRDGKVVPTLRSVRIMFIAEAPGYVEQEKLVPLVGSSGTLFHRLVGEVGIHEYYCTNMAKHRPPKVGGKQSAPKPEHLDACNPFLNRELDLLKPEWVVLMGKTAAKFVIPGNFSMKSVIGQTETVRYPEEDNRVVKFIVVWHPAAFLHQTKPTVQAVMMNEFRRALAGIVATDVPHYPIRRMTCRSHQ